jgi:hypothetical protein
MFNYPGHEIVDVHVHGGPQIQNQGLQQTASHCDLNDVLIQRQNDCAP